MIRVTTELCLCRTVLENLLIQFHVIDYKKNRSVDFEHMIQYGEIF